MRHQRYRRVDLRRHPWGGLSRHGRQPQRWQIHGGNSYSTLDGTDLSNVMGLLPGYALPGAGWYVSVAGFSYAFCRIVASSGGWIGTCIDGQTGAEAWNYLGFPIRIVQKLPLAAAATSLTGQAMMLFGDMALAASFGERREMRVKFLTERFAEFDQIGVVGTERFDVNIHSMGDNTTAGPLVALVAP